MYPNLIRALTTGRVLDASGIANPASVHHHRWVSGASRCGLQTMVHLGSEAETPHPDRRTPPCAPRAAPRRPRPLHPRSRDRQPAEVSVGHSSLPLAAMYCCAFVCLQTRVPQFVVCRLVGQPILAAAAFQAASSFTLGTPPTARPSSTYPILTVQPACGVSIRDTKPQAGTSAFTDGRNSTSGRPDPCRPTPLPSHPACPPTPRTASTRRSF